MNYKPTEKTSENMMSPANDYHYFLKMFNNFYLFFKTKWKGSNFDINHSIIFYYDIYVGVQKFTPIC